MKDIRFYLEHDTPQNKRKNIHSGNVLALNTATSWIACGERTYETISAVYFEPDSPVCGSGCTQAYLTHNCKRISETKARQIHPNLFVYLDNSNN